MEGVKEYVFHEEALKQKPKPKTVNYIENVKMANNSKSKGGYLGLKVT